MAPGVRLRGDGVCRASKGLKYLGIISLYQRVICRTLLTFFQAAGWSSLVARKAHNLEVNGSNPFPATSNQACVLTKGPPPIPSLAKDSETQNGHKQR